MTANKATRVVMTGEMRDAVDAYCAALTPPVDVSEFIRRTVMEKIGRKDLLVTMPKRGRPKPPPPVSRKKTSGAKAARKP